MEQPNIVLLVMDTARAKTVIPNLRNETLPNLSKLAADSVIFENTTSVAPWTLPSHASLFTGQYTHLHGTDADSPEFNPDIAPLAERLSQAGYRTGGISANPWISPEFGFDAGYDDFSMKWDSDWNSFDITAAVNSGSVSKGVMTMLKNASVAQLPALMKNLWYKQTKGPTSDNGAKKVTSRAIDWLNARTAKDERFFLFLNYLEPHLPYTPPLEYSREFLSNEEIRRIDEIDQDPWKYITNEVDHDTDELNLLKKLYLTEIKYLDDYVGRLIEHLKSKEIYDSTAIFVIGDHGENIGEHDLMDHQYSLHDTLINVPLIVKHPELISGIQDDQIVESRDLYPTILELAGVDIGDLDSSVSQQPLTDISRDYAFSEYLTPQPAVNTLGEWVDADEQFAHLDRVLRTIRRGEWKVIESSDGNHELYHITADPDEETNMYVENEDLANQMLEELTEMAGFLSRSGSDGNKIDEKSRQRLEELGYIQ